MWLGKSEVTLTPIHYKITAGVIVILAVLSGFLLATSASFRSGVRQGERNIYALWNKDKAEKAEALYQLRGKIQQQELGHRQETARIADQLRKTEAEHEKAVAALDAERTRRLRLSKERADIYARLAKAGPAECRGLAEHAARLDQSLEEGRGLVGELAATVGRREDQLRLLGAQIKNDRNLMEGP